RRALRRPRRARGGEVQGRRSHRRAVPAGRGEEGVGGGRRRAQAPERPGGPQAEGRGGGGRRRRRDRQGASMSKAPRDIPARERIIVALDVPDRSALGTLLDRLDGRPAFYKVGLELFVGEGERAIELVRARGGRVFLDLKLHDIPETVARAVASAARNDAELLTGHTSGGYEMLSRPAGAAKGKVTIP